MNSFPILKHLLLVAAILLTLLQCKQADDSFLSDQLTPLWKSEPSLRIPESVRPDPSGTFLYVSNMDGKPMEKDGKGFISKLNNEGKIIELQWITGLDAPKGIGISGDSMYVSNITEIVLIRISDRKILQRFPVEGSVFLNDISVAANGKVYCSDMKTGKIHLLWNDTVTTWMEGPEFENCNGLYSGEQGLYAGTANKILEINTTSKVITTFADVPCNVDGLEASGEDSFIFSDWKGSVYRVKRQGKAELLLDTSKAGKNAADIGFDSKSGILYVPTFMDNRVEAYRLK